MISNYRALRQKARQEGRIKSVLGLAYTDPLKPHNCFRSPELPGLPPPFTDKEPEAHTSRD